MGANGRGPPVETPHTSLAVSYQTMEERREVVANFVLPLIVPTWARLNLGGAAIRATKADEAKHLIKQRSWCAVERSQGGDPTKALPSPVVTRHFPYCSKNVTERTTVSSAYVNDRNRTKIDTARVKELLRVGTLQPQPLLYHLHGIRPEHLLTVPANKKQPSMAVRTTATSQGVDLAQKNGIADGSRSNQKTPRVELLCLHIQKGTLRE